MDEELEWSLPGSRNKNPSAASSPQKVKPRASTVSIAWLNRIAHPSNQEARTYTRWIWKLRRERRKYYREAVEERLAEIRAEMRSLWEQTRSPVALHLSVRTWEEMDDRRLFLSGQEMALQQALREGWLVPLESLPLSELGHGSRNGSEPAVRMEWDPFKD
jgi:hypothetical protein